MARKKKEVAVIDMDGAKTVAKKRSLVRGVKTFITVFTIIWFALLIWFPLHVKNTYSGPIKKSIVVSMFYDLQQGIVDQYQALLDSVADSINLEKPISIALDKVKLAEDAVDKVTDTTATAREHTTAASKQTASVKKLSGFAKMFGAKTDDVDKVVATVDQGIEKTNAAIATVDDTAARVNAQLDKIKTDLTRVAQTEVDTMLDTAIKSALDKQSITQLISTCQLLDQRLSAT